MTGLGKRFRSELYFPVNRGGHKTRHAFAKIARVSLGLLAQLLGRVQPIGETDAQRFIALDPARGHQHIERMGVADDARQPQAGAIHSLALEGARASVMRLPLGR
jgi:hypothetical protein